MEQEDSGSGSGSGGRFRRKPRPYVSDEAAALRVPPNSLDAAQAELADALGARVAEAACCSTTAPGTPSPTVCAPKTFTGAITN